MFTAVRDGLRMGECSGSNQARFDHWNDVLLENSKNVMSIMEVTYKELRNLNFKFTVANSHLQKSYLIKGPLSHCLLDFNYVSILSS